MEFFGGDMFGGMFDFNGDGKVDIGEEFMAYKMYEEVTNEDVPDEFDEEDFDESEDEDYYI